MIHPVLLRICGRQNCCTVEGVFNYLKASIVGRELIVVELHQPSAENFYNKEMMSE